MIGHSRPHSCSYSKDFVNSGKVKMHVVECYGMLKVLHFLWESIAQPSKPPKLIRIVRDWLSTKFSWDLVSCRIACRILFLCSTKDIRAISGLGSCWRINIDYPQRGIFGILTKGIPDRLQISPMAACGSLNPNGQPASLAAFSLFLLV